MKKKKKEVLCVYVFYEFLKENQKDARQTLQQRQAERGSYWANAVQFYFAN